jgi:hypothetical protein
VQVCRGQAAPHWFATPSPPQVWGAGQPPQSSVPAHPSAIGPHAAPALAQVARLQATAPPPEPEPDEDALADDDDDGADV